MMVDRAISGTVSIWRAKRCEHPYQAHEMCPPWGSYCCHPTSSSCWRTYLCFLRGPACKNAMAFHVQLQQQLYHSVLGPVRLLHIWAQCPSLKCLHFAPCLLKMPSRIAVARSTSSYPTWQPERDLSWPLAISLSHPHRRVSWLQKIRRGDEGLLLQW
jgi:hypothetical protein